MRALSFKRYTDHTQRDVLAEVVEKISKELHITYMLFVITEDNARNSGTLCVVLHGQLDRRYDDRYQDIIEVLDFRAR